MMSGEPIIGTHAIVSYQILRLTEDDDYKDYHTGVVACLVPDEKPLSLTVADAIKIDIEEHYES